ncbi:MAG: P22 coat protein - protein 5 domain protein [Clostridia bacterium]|nr:P22 coat protein - protein 5 domain protein [Clostridia bacterium]
MAITNFIPTIWNESLLHSLDNHYVGVANCNREFEGEIKNKGSVVKICGVGSINIGDYTKNTDMDSPQALSDTVRELTIDQAKYFNFQIDDIDRAQCSPKLMDSAMKIAASALADVADRYIYSFFENHSQTITTDALTPENIFDFIVKAREQLYTNNVFDDTEVVLEISPSVASILYKSKLDLSTSNNELLETGCIGSLAGCKIFVTNGIHTEGIASDETIHHCFMRTKRAIAFAEQLSEIDAYRPEHRFADAVKGLHLYGAQIVYPTELVVLDCMILSN